MGLSARLHAGARRFYTRTRPRLRATADSGPPPPRVRMGLVGLGTIGREHADVLASHPSCRLTAIVSRDPARKAEVESLGALWFPDAETLFSSETVDAVLIATPHPSHADLTVAALSRGLHVLCEKPLAIRASDVDRIIAAAEAADRVVAVVFQNRANLAYRRIADDLAGGAFGRMLRVEISETYPRTGEYYSSAPWRGSWAGEGGGVLVNQAPHVLDRYLWLFGQPSAITAQTDTRAHPIEAEDTVSLLVRHADGMHGAITVTTAPSPMTSRLSVIAENGTLDYADGVLKTAHQTRQGAWERSEAVAPPQPTADLLAALYDNFARALAGLEAPWVSAREARRSVELSNAAYLSAAGGAVLALPSDTGAFDALLARRAGQEIAEPRA